MALKHAVLASLLDGPASGYELAKRMDVSVANFWHALPTQIYAELRALEEAGLVTGEDVREERRPVKRVFTLSEVGLAELEAFTRRPPRPRTLKDELLVQVQAADTGDRAAVRRALEERRAASLERIALFDALIERFLRGRTEEEFLAGARRIGPYLNLRRGRDFEAENVRWYEWAAAALAARDDGEG